LYLLSINCSPSGLRGRELQENKRKGAGPSSTAVLSGLCALDDRVHIVIDTRERHPITLKNGGDECWGYVYHAMKYAHMHVM